jgi:hypothetical protein
LPDCGHDSAVNADGIPAHWDNHRRIFRALAFVDGRGIGRHQRVEFTKRVCDRSTVEADNDLARLVVDIVDIGGPDASDHAG